MATIEDRKQKAIKPTIRQKVWSYMRRNRIFVISDVMAITGANYKNIREMFKVYEVTGYIEVISREKPYTSTRLKLIKNTGVKVPTHDKQHNILFDYYTKEKIRINPLSSLEKILGCLNKKFVTKEEINKQSKLSTSTTQKNYVKLKELEIMTRVVPTIKSKLGYYLFSVDIQKAKKLQEEIADKKIKLLNQKLAERQKKISEKRKPANVPKTLVKLLDAMTENKMSKRGLDEIADVRIGTAKSYWDRFIKRGVVSKIVPIQRDSKRVLFKIYPNKVKELKEKLLDGEKL